MPVGNHTAPDEAELVDWLSSDRAPMHWEAVMLQNGQTIVVED